MLLVRGPNGWPPSLSPPDLVSLRIGWDGELAGNPVAWVLILGGSPPNEIHASGGLRNTAPSLAAVRCRPEKADSNAGKPEDFVVSAITCRLRIVPNSRFFSILLVFGKVPVVPTAPRRITILPQASSCDEIRKSATGTTLALNGLSSPARQELRPYVL